MKCSGDFKYKGMRVREAGVFTNAAGKDIKYDKKIILSVDEIVDGEVLPREFGIEQSNPILKDLSNLEVYDDISIDFDVNIFRNNVRLIPISVTYLFDNN